MPLYEYRCRDCAHEFEMLIRTGTTPVCPSCHRDALDRLLSVFGVATESTRQSAMTKARAGGEKVRREQAVAEQERMAHHDD